MDKLLATLDGDEWRDTPQGYVQLTLFGGPESFSLKWPAAGALVGGKCYERRQLAPPTSSLRRRATLPTPVAYDATPGGPNNHYKGLGNLAKHYPEILKRCLRDLGIELTGEPQEHLPEIAEWLMGFPARWTATIQTEERYEDEE